ncbi:MAG: AMP-binding protein, partial [Pseudomonadota bacterium]
MPERSAAIENDEVFSYLELAAGILFLRDAFTGKGLTTETLAIVDVSSPLDNRMILFALRMLGVHVVPVHHVSHLVELSKKTGAVLVLSEVEVKRGVRRAPPDLAVPVLLAPASLRQAMRRPRDPSADPILLTGCHSIFSSGTTGRSKRVACDSASENGILAHRAEHLAFSTETVANFGAMGPWGVGAFRVPNAVWHVGGTTVFDNRRGQRPDLHAHGVTHFFTVPTALAQVAQDWPEDLPRADHVTVLAAGSPVSVPVVKAVTARMTNRIVNLCGCSETPRLPMIRAFDGDPDELNWLDLLPGTTTEIMREDGTPCAVGEIGILRYLQEADAIEGYEDDPEATAHHFRDGAFYPGDLAVRRADGRVRFAGR